eukprot:6204485-Pleurochrysis_carterae.AAC.1
MLSRQHSQSWDPKFQQSKQHAPIPSAHAGIGGNAHLGASQARHPCVQMQSASRWDQTRRCRQQLHAKHALPCVCAAPPSSPLLREETG